MDEYRKAKLQQLDDNSKFLKCCEILGFTTNYSAGQYTVYDNGKYLDKMTASEWLKVFKAVSDERQKEQR